MEGDLKNISCENLRNLINDEFQIYSNACWNSALEANLSSIHDSNSEQMDISGKTIHVLLDEVFRRVHSKDGCD